MGDHPIMHEVESLDKSGEFVIGIFGYFTTAIDSNAPMTVLTLVSRSSLGLLVTRQWRSSHWFHALLSDF